MSSIGFIDWLLALFGVRSGGADQTLNLNNYVTEVNPAQGSIEQYVVTPCGYRIRVPQAEDVSHSVGEMLPNVRQSLSQVPPLPHTVLELLREVQDANSTAGSVANVAASDPVLAAALLRTVNSSAMGLNRKITSVTESVSYLGFALVKSVLIRLRLDETMPTTGKAASDAEDLWVHSLATSYIAEALAERTKNVDRGFVSTLGLLHDIGKLAMLSQLKLQGQLANAPSNTDETRRGREARLLGIDHAGLGANLAHTWGLPSDLVKAIRFHHHPHQAFEPTDPLPLRQGAYVVFIANQLAKLGFGHADDIEISPMPPEADALLGFDTAPESLFDTRVCAAITRAILFAAENTKQNKTAIKRLLRLRKGDDAEKAANSATTLDASRVTVDDTFVAELFDKESDAACLLRASGTSRESDIGKLIHAGLFHQAKLSVPQTLTGPAAELLRCLLPNLIEPRQTERTVELLQQRMGETFTLAVRSESLAFKNRIRPDATTEQGVSLLHSEFAGLINIGWIKHIRTSADGSMLTLEMRGK